MKKLFVLAMFVLASVTAFTQPQFGPQQSAPKQFTPQEQELIDLSNQKWTWMSEKNADKLAELFHDNAMFVHMGGSWGKQQEVDIIRGGMIWYKNADIHSQEVKFVEDNAIVYSNIHLTSEVGGNEVCFPFMVSEVFVKKEGQWKLGALIFTRLLEPERE
ncbi:MAG: nuclear transport factor 2 family protein [Bacteroidales bacterium]|nr:nuclear transport factor 2 family protein [Bacteroidales bacterium]